MPILVILSKLDNTDICQTALTMSRSLMSVGHQILVAFGSPENIVEHKQMLDDWQQSGAELLPISGLNKSVNPLARRRLLKEIEERHLIDPIQSILTFDQRDRSAALWLADRMAEQSRVPCVFWAESPHEFRGRFGDWQASGFGDLLRKHLGLALCTSEDAEQDFARRFDISSDRLERLPKPVSIPAQQKISEADRTRLRNRWSAGEDDFLWVNPSQLTIGNGQDLLLDAFIPIHRDRGNARLVLIDQGPRERSQEDCEFRNNIRQRIEEERLGRTVFIAEPDDDPADIMAVCDGAIFSHRHRATRQHGEVLSSLRDEIPTILTDCADICRYLESGQDAQIVESGNEDSLKQAINDMMAASIGDRKWMGTGGHAVIAEHFDSEKIGRRFLASIEQLLNQRPKEILKRSS